MNQCSQTAVKLCESACRPRLHRSEQDFEALFETHRASVHAFVLSILRDHDAAEDVTQEVFLALLTRAPDCADDQLEYWLLKIARNASFQHLRARKRLRARERRLDPEYSGKTARPEVDEAILRPDVAAALDALDEKWQAPVALHYLHHLTQPEVAAVLGIPVGTAGSRIARGIARMRERLSGEAEASPRRHRITRRRKGRCEHMNPEPEATLIGALEALELLAINEQELQTLVVHGDLRAFRSNGTMKFKRGDVMKIKDERRVSPVIIQPSSEKRKPGASGILDARRAGPAGSGILTAVSSSAATDSNETSPVLIPELDPIDDGMSTQEQTVIADTAETIIANPTESAEQTVVDSQASTAITRSEPTQKGPRISRVGRSVVKPRRTATVYEAKRGHPIATALLSLQAAALIFTASIFGVMTFKGHVYVDDPDNPRVVERVIPPYLHHLGVYEGMYHGADGPFGILPGTPKDHRPEGEPAPTEDTLVGGGSILQVEWRSAVSHQVPREQLHRPPVFQRSPWVRLA